MRFDFGELSYDTARMQLRRFDAPIRLTPKAMALLECLIVNRPNVVLQRDLYDQLWPDVIVHHGNLKNLIADLRAALDDHERDGRFIRTVHGRSYAFTDDVLESLGGNGRAPDSRAVLDSGTRRIPLAEGENIAGRALDASLHVDHPSISRRHARILVDGDRVRVEDLGSRNGTFVRGRRIDAPVEVADGDEVRLGFLAFTLRVAARNGESETASWN